jgi:hypothetical protein
MFFKSANLQILGLNPGESAIAKPQISEVPVCDSENFKSANFF